MRHENLQDDVFVYRDVLGGLCPQEVIDREFMVASSSCITVVPEVLVGFLTWLGGIFGLTNGGDGEHMHPISKLSYIVCQMAMARGGAAEDLGYFVASSCLSLGLNTFLEDEAALVAAQSPIPGDKNEAHRTRIAEMLAQAFGGLRGIETLVEAARLSEKPASLAATAMLVEAFQESSAPLGTREKLVEMALLSDYVLRFCMVLVRDSREWAEQWEGMMKADA